MELGFHVYYYGILGVNTTLGAGNVTAGVACMEMRTVLVQDTYGRGSEAD